MTINSRLPALAATLAITLAAALLAACSPQPEAAAWPIAPYVHPESGLQVIPLTITDDGKEQHFRIELAQTPQQQYMGLRFREKMAADEGMIFPREPARIATFTMQNTQIPLDMVFIGEDRVIDSILHDTTPFEQGPFVSEEPAIAVLELNGGTTARLGIKPGDKVEW